MHYTRPSNLVCRVILAGKYDHNLTYSLLAFPPDLRKVDAPANMKTTMIISVTTGPSMLKSMSLES